MDLDSVSVSIAPPVEGNARGHAPVKHDSSFEFDLLCIFAVRAGKLADIGLAPRVDRDLERGAGQQTRHEACHDRYADRPMDMGQFEVRHDIAGNLELLEGYLGVTASGEEDNVPVVVAHALGFRMVVERGEVLVELGGRC